MPAVQFLGPGTLVADATPPPESNAAQIREAEY